MPIDPKKARPSQRPLAVLVAEDEPAIRRLLVTVLEQRGFEVVAAASGDEALRLADRQDGAFDLLVTDVVMPGLSGTELAAQLRDAQPDLDVLFISGYTQHPEAVAASQTARASGHTLFLGKPFAPDRLIESLREIVDPAAWPTSR